MTTEAKKYVTYYTCKCDWVTKYCDEYHLSGALVPVSVLDQYRVKNGEGL